MYEGASKQTPDIKILPRPRPPPRFEIPGTAPVRKDSGLNVSLMPLACCKKSFCMIRPQNHSGRGTLKIPPGGAEQLFVISRNGDVFI